MRPEKSLLLDEIKTKINGSQALVLARYKKLEPNKAAGFRADLAKTGGSLSVVKKRIFLKAAENAGFSIDAALLDGHIAVVFVEQDLITTTKTIYQFCQANEQVMEVIGGRYEGAFCSAHDVEQISKLPSKDEMRAQLLGTLEAPLAQTLAVLEALLTSTIYCLENKSQQSQS